MKVGRRALPAALALATLGATGAEAAVKPADTVLRNGYVHTVDKRDSRAEALAIRAGKIVYVGSDRGVRRYVGKRTKVTNLGGRMVMPGLQDAHIHEMLGGELALKCDLQFAPLTLDQFKQRIGACLKDTADKEPDGWLQVESWYRQAMLPPGTDATKADLDALSTKRPIIVTSSDHHTALANSRALEIAGVTAATPDPVGGHIVRDAQGNPTGILEDRAAGLVRSKVPPPTAEDNVAAAAAALDAMRRQGITSFMSQVSSKEEMTAFKALRKAGKLTARAHFGPNVSAADAKTDMNKAVGNLLALKRQFDTGGTVARPGLTVRNSSELGLDGVLQAPAHTARMLEPYFVNAGTPAQPSWVPGTDRGPEYYAPDTINKLVAALAKAGIDPQIHAIGDRSVRDALNAVEYARKTVKARDFRPQISHAEVVHPDDDKRFKQLNVTPVMSFQWAKPAPDSIEAAKDFMGPERFARMEPEGSLYKAGARVAFGSDWPVDPLDEWFALQVGITRRNRDSSGKYAGYPLGDEIGLPRKYALRAITMNSAYALHHDDKTGSLERGKLADLIVLDQNVLRVPVMEIADTKVLLTMVGGKPVYKAGGFR